MKNVIAIGICIIYNFIYIFRVGTYIIKWQLNKLYTRIIPNNNLRAIIYNYFLI